MKHLLRNIPALAVLLVAPQFASAATKTWVTLAAAPATTNITAGVATNLTTTLTWRSGSGASARFVGPALLSISVAPSDPSITIALSQTNFTFPSTDTTFNPTLTFTTTALTPSNTYVVTIIGNTNPPTPVNPGVTPITNTFIVTMATAAPFNPVKVWTNGGVNGNWSTAGNWTPSGAPGSSNDVQFSDVGIVGTVATVNNTVDTSFGIASLTYGQTNNYHTTAITSGVTLSMTGTNGFAAGTGTDAGDGIQTVTTITGAGAAILVSNSVAVMNVDQSHPVASGNSSTTATLDMSAVDQFTAAVSRILVGADTTTALRGACGILYLAKTNLVKATPGSASPQLDVGDNTQAGASPGLSSYLLLGRTNAFFVDSVTAGRGKSGSSGGSSILFNGSVASPVAYFRGTNGTASRVGLWAIGDAWGGKAGQNSGTNDFTTGTVNALVDLMYVGKGASQAIINGANIPGNGTLNFASGNFDINTLEVGYGIDAAGIGVVNVTGGSLVVNTSLELGHTAGSSGTLNLSSATASANSGITAGGGTAVITLGSSTLSVTNSGATLGSLSSPLSNLAATNSTLKLAVQSGSASAFVGTLSCDGANALSFTFIPVLTSLPAQFPVVQYTTPDGNLGSFSIGTLPSVQYGGYISNNVANATLDLVITNGPVVPPLVWSGQINSNWDTSTANWKTNGNPAVYQQGYPVVQFNDALTGTNLVNLTTALTPGSLAVNNSSEDYTFAGAGKLSGSTGLTKSGSRTLLLIESGGDDFTGQIKISNGTLQIGNGGTSGTIPPVQVSIDTPATLTFNRSDNLTAASVISGLGTILQNGGSIVALNGSNSAFAGQIQVGHGTLQPGNVAALGSASATVTVSNNATLDVNGQKFNNNQLVTVTGAGVGGNGAIVNNSTNSPTQILRNVTLAGDTTFGGYSDWDIHSSGNPASDATLSTSGNPYDLTKVGTNTVTIFGVQVDGALADIAIQAGTISFERNTTSMGDPSKTVTVFTNATLQFQNASNIWSKNVVLKDGGTLRGINRDEFAGPVTLESGTGNALAGTGAQLILDSAVGGAGGLAKSGGGSLILTSPSTYAGATLVSQGTLALINSGSIDSSTNITLNTGAVLDLSALGDPTLTMTSGRSLAGAGTIIGNLTMVSGSSLIVGVQGTNTLGTLTITNDVSLQAGSTNAMQIAKSGTNAQSDLLVATNISYGGTLSVSGTGGAFATGDIFKLFSAGSYSSSFNAFSLPVGTTWDTSRLGIDGTIKVVSVTRPKFTSIAPTNGAFQLSLSGPAGNSYHIWASTNVGATPVVSTWTPLVTNGLFGVAGTAAFLDSSATNFASRFYLITIP